MFPFLQTELKLSSIKQQYLEQQLFTSELEQVVKTEARAKSSVGSSSAAARSRDALSLVTATAELQHCLDVGEEGMALLGLQPEHLRAVLEGVKGDRVCGCVRVCLTPQGHDRVGNRLCWCV